MSPMLLFWTDLVYLVISAAVAFWVGWTFHRNGRVFLLEVFHHQEKRADSVNHLILEGFYLISIGFVPVGEPKNVIINLKGFKIDAHEMLTKCSTSHQRTPEPNL